MRFRTHSLLMSLPLIGFAALAAHAQNTSVAASDTSYVGTTLAGDSGVVNYVKTSKNATTGVYYTSNSFLDAEATGASANPSDQFSSFGLIDYANPVVFNAPVASVQNVQLQLTEIYFSHGAAGFADVFLATDSATKDYYDKNNPSPLKYLSASDVTDPAGVGTQLGTVYKLGTAYFNNAGVQSQPSGIYDTFNLDLSDPAASALFLAQLNSGGNSGSFSRPIRAWRARQLPPAWRTTVRLSARRTRRRG